MLETFIFKVEAVFEQTLFEEFGDIVKGDVNQYHADHGGNHIEPDVQAQGIKPCFHRITVQPYGQYNQPYTCYDRIEDLLAAIELQFFLVPRAYTGDADKQERGKFAVRKISVIVYHPPFDASVYVAEDTSPMVKHGRVDGILEELHQHGDIDDRTEYLVEPL